MLKGLKKILSYIWPHTTVVSSQINGSLEITSYNGKKVLNSSHANYSFGSLQRILEYGLSRIEISSLHSVLLLGLGGGSIIGSLRQKFNFKGFIRAVEIDEKIISIAKSEFNITPAANLIIENTGAFEFVQNHQKQYDLVIIDLFIDNEVPRQFYSARFCNNLSKLITDGGYFLFNLGIDGVMPEEAKEVITCFQDKSFKTELLEHVGRTNNLLTGQKNPS